jgi:ribonuclease HII
VSDTIRGGLDEVGWGALAGPVISVVALLKDSAVPLLPPGVKDSKKTTEAQRTMLYPALCRIVVDVGIGHAWPWELDQYGPGNGLQLSYKRALEDLTVAVPEVLYVDGNSDVKSWKGRQVVEPKADNKYKQVSVASIIAKHVRDTMMIDYSKERRRQGLPDYGWEQNKGYGTQDHLDAIDKYGLIVDANDSTTNHSRYLHRLSYCKKLRKGNAAR